MGEPDKLKEILLFVAFVVGASTLLLSAFQFWSGKLPSAAGLLVCFVICGVFVFLPQIKSFKLWQVEVELNQTLDEAKLVTDRLRRLAAISAKSTYMQMAWGNRMGTPPVAEKQAILDEIDKQLVELRAKPEEIESIKKPFVQMIALDFYFLYTRTIRSYAELRFTALIERRARNNSPASIEPELQHSSKISEWTARTNEVDPISRLSNSTLEAELTRFSPREGEWLNADEREIVDDFRKVIVRLYAECEKKGGFTAAAAAYYDKNNEHTKALAESLFSNVLAGFRK
ncbi:MAG TPA: hypothetical protein VNR39_13455 [Pseudolabrys sp.]|nr:hypothetical protein [Pseudolabrys sp.]